MTLRVAVADDEALVRRGLTVLLTSEPGLEVVGEAADGDAAVALVRRSRPDVVLMDVRMPGRDGIDATRAIASDSALPTRVLVLTTFDLDEHVFAALRAGASGFLPKDTEPEELLRAIRVVAGGDALLSPSVTRRLVAEFVDRTHDQHPDVPALDGVTDREVDVLRLVARGLSNHEIAEELVVSYATVKTHVSRLLMKLRARDRAQLVVAAYESGLVRPGA